MFRQKLQPLVLLLISSLLLSTGLALAHGGAEETEMDPKLLVEQSVAFLQAEPSKIDEASANLTEVLELETAEQVNLELVQAATVALGQGAIPEAVHLLDRSLGREAETLGPVVEVNLNARLYIAMITALLLTALGAWGLGRRSVSATH